MSDSLSLLWSPVLMMRQSDLHCLDWRCRSYWCRSFPDCGFAALLPRQGGGKCIAISFNPSYAGIRALL